MAKKSLDAPFLVVLRDGFSAAELEYLMQFTGGLKVKSGAKLRALRCADIESESAFLRADVIVPGKDAPLVVRLPYHFVFTIIGEEENEAPGFVGSFEPE